MKKLLSSTIILALLTLSSSCGPSTEKSKQQIAEIKYQSTNHVDKVKSDKDTVAENLNLNDFNRLSDDIEGCSCYFSETNEKFKNEEFLFAADSDSIGFIAVNNELTKLKLISTTREPNTFSDNDHIDIYRSKLYKVTVNIKYKKSSGDETWLNDGTITIETHKGKKVAKKFIGECGC